MPNRVIAARGEAFNASKFGETAGRAATGKDCDEIDGLGDKGAGHRHHGFLDQLLQPPQRPNGRSGM